MPAKITFLYPEGIKGPELPVHVRPPWKKVFAVKEVLTGHDLLLIVDCQEGDRSSRLYKSEPAPHLGSEAELSEFAARSCQPDNLLEEIKPGVPGFTGEYILGHLPVSLVVTHDLDPRQPPLL